MFATRNVITPEVAQTHMAELFGIFGETGETVPRCERVEPEDMPETPRRLLAHEGHMTVTLESFHEAPSNLTVLATARDGNLYARKILLSSSRTGECIQYGIMRFNFNHCSDEVRDKIVEGKTPLGRILIEHGVLRRVSLLAPLRVHTTAEMMKHFAMDRPTDVYGRFATIYCNDEPAVDLLEIVPQNS